MAFGRSDDTTEKGPGLARGPALIIGAILSAFGLLLFLDAGNTPTAGFPDATVDGPTFLGFEANGWTAWFTTAAGALLLFGAAQHLLAKTMSLLVGLALAACVVISLIDGDDVLGLAATNVWTKVGWAIAAGLLLFNTLAPRVNRSTDADNDERRRDHVDRRHETGAAATNDRADEARRMSGSSSEGRSESTQAYNGRAGGYREETTR